MTHDPPTGSPRDAGAPSGPLPLLPPRDGGGIWTDGGAAMADRARTPSLLRGGAGGGVNGDVCTPADIARAGNAGPGGGESHKTMVPDATFARGRCPVN